jgi:hypothetical protein
MAPGCAISDITSTYTTFHVHTNLWQPFGLENAPSGRELIRDDMVIAKPSRQPTGHPRLVN